MAKTITLELKKKTILEAYNQVKIQQDLGFPNFQKGEPLPNLINEIKRQIMKQKKQEKLGWKEFLHFWPLSVVVPLMLLSILLAPLFQ
tara:strand:+ start:698 stop:961 length:264 start_codon:yes stop_codon:yes gene_type:complete